MAHAPTRPNTEELLLIVFAALAFLGAYVTLF